MTRRTGPSAGIRSMASTAALVGVFASAPPSTTNRDRLRAGKTSPQSSTTSPMSGRRSEVCEGVPGTAPSSGDTGTNAGSNASGKLDEPRAASAIWAAVSRIFARPNGSSSSNTSTGRFQWNRALCTDWGSRWPSASTVTCWLPLSTVVIIVRSMGASLGGTTSVGTAREVSAAFSCGRKCSSPLSSELGAPRNGWRSSASIRPCSTHTSRSAAMSARRLTWDSASAAPLTPPAEVPETTSTRAVHPASRSISAYGSSPLAGALTSRSSSRATPPIQTARETPPLSTTPKRTSSGGTPVRSCSSNPGRALGSLMAHSSRREVSPWFTHCVVVDNNEEPPGPAQIRDDGSESEGSQGSGRSEAEAAELLGVALPVLGHLDVQVEVHPLAEQLLDAGARVGADLAQAGPTTTDDDRLLRVALDEHVDPHVEQRLGLAAALARHDLVDDDREAVRQLVAHPLERRLSHQLGDHDQLGLVGEHAVGVEGPRRGRQQLGEHRGDLVDLVAPGGGA